MSNTFKHLTQKDIEEGKGFIAMYSSLPELERMQARLYIQALSDRNEIVKDMESADRGKVVKAG